MSAPAHDPAPAAEPAPAPPRLLRATAVVATVGAVVALLGIVALLRPVETPVQDCGTVAAFVLEGRSNLFVDPADPPAGVTEAEATANNERPCRVRVATAAKPGGIAFVAGFVTALAAALVEVSVRGSRRLRRRRAHHGRAAPGGP